MRLTPRLLLQPSRRTVRGEGRSHTIWPYFERAGLGPAGAGVSADVRDARRGRRPLRLDWLADGGRGEGHRARRLAVRARICRLLDGDLSGSRLAALDDRTG